MKLTKEILKKITEETDSDNKLFKRNILKEYLQVFVLDFIYSHPEYSNLVFYGGSCLSHCFGLPRLSEDLDFVDLKKNIDKDQLINDLKTYFEKNTDLKVTFKSQKFRINLLFPILKDLSLSNAGETDNLLLKLEIFTGFNFCSDYKMEFKPLFKYNKSILVKTFDLSTLMSTKIRAVLYRQWRKIDKDKNVLIHVKGRDYFDLFWYLDQNIKPNLGCFPELKNSNLKEELLKIIQKVDKRSIRLDLEPLIKNNNFVKDFSNNFKDIITKKIEESPF
jgi:hypothetical protein